jgi:acyl-coenzyme A thioesterase PaaI-like protein
VNPLPGAELFARFIEHSPFAQLVELRVERIDTDQAELTMPYRSELATAGDIVHGGAIGTLIDVAATGGVVGSELRRRRAKNRYGRLHGRPSQPRAGQRPQGNRARHPPGQDNLPLRGRSNR